MMATAFWVYATACSTWKNTVRGSARRVVLFVAVETPPLSRARLNGCAHSFLSLWQLDSGLVRAPVVGCPSRTFQISTAPSAQDIRRSRHSR